MSNHPLISIILPSFRDPRIITAIASVRIFDDINSVRIIVIDGGSDQKLLNQISQKLLSKDILVAEPDKGIFDALNKGLDRVDTPFVGWLGSDDLFSGAVKASDVTQALADNDLFVGSQYMISGLRIKRFTRASYSGHGLVRYGLHNPHYSTFGRATCLCSRRFDTDNIASDIGYFLDVFSGNPRVVTTDRVAVLQEEGGYSNSSKIKTLLVNHAAFKYYKKMNGWPLAVISIAIKIGYKIISLIRYKIKPDRWDNEFMIVSELYSKN